MFENRQTKNTVFSWALIGITFVAVILFLLVRFLGEGKKAAEVQSQDKLIGYVSTWAEFTGNEGAIAKDFADIFAEAIKSGQPIGDKVMIDYAKSIVDNTDISHILFCKGGTVVCDQDGNTDCPINVMDYMSVDSYITIAKGVHGDCDEDSLIAYTPVGTTNKSVICITHLNDVAKRFKVSAFEDVSFGALMTREGEILAVFDRFADTNSNFIAEGNIITPARAGAYSKSDYGLFSQRFVNGPGAAVTTVCNADKRTLVVSPTRIENVYFAYGVRQSAVDKLTKNNFSSVKGTVIKLAIVIVVFSIFVVSTIVFSQIRSKERGRALEDKADTDLLTELNNKAATERKIQEYIQDNPDGRAMMFILDIDNFKKINDTMGHAFGDTLLRTLGKEIKTEFRMTDIIGRTGGDEFMVFLKDVTDDMIIEREANRITRFFHDFKAGGDYVKYSASASIGAAIFPDDAKNFKDLYVAADQALYRAKKRGKNQLVFYNEEVRK